MFISKGEFGAERRAGSNHAQDTSNARAGNRSYGSRAIIEVPWMPNVERKKTLAARADLRSSSVHANQT